MTVNPFHPPKSTPPPAIPPVLEHLKSAYKQWVPIQKNMPKRERFGLGQKIDWLFIELLEIVHRASFSSGDIKITLLGEALLKIDSLRFFMQLAWELKLIPTNKFSLIGSAVEAIGKMIGGWRKGLLTKTPRYPSADGSRGERS